MRRAKTRLGVILLPYSVSFERMLGAARRAESLGFDSVWIADHLQRGETPMLECWATISALAASTQKVRLGSLATCNSFRNPALLAKVVASVSEISGGRVDLGIGIGYDAAEHRGYGYPFPRADERVERLSETLAILKLLWRERDVSFRGKFTTLEGATCIPRPSTEPRIWVAGRSEKVLSVAAANRVYGANILPYSGTLAARRISSEKELEVISERIRSRDLKSSMYCGDGGVVIAENRASLARAFERAGRRQGLSGSEMEKRVGNLSAVFGTVSHCKEKVDWLSSLGFEEMMFIFPGWQQGDYRNMDVFAEAFLR